MRKQIITIVAMVLLGTVSYAQQINLDDLSTNVVNNQSEYQEYSFTSSYKSVKPAYTFDENFNIKEKSISNNSVATYSDETSPVASLGFSENSKPLIGQLLTGTINVGKPSCLH